MAGRPHLTHWDRVRAAVVWDVLAAALGDRADPLVVVDAGGGTGGFAVPLAALGHQVTVVDPSPDSLAGLARRAADEGVADRLVGVQGDLGTLLDAVAPATADLVLCHSVLELVDDTAAALATVAAVLKPGGLASVLVSNRAAVVLGRALDGRFAEAGRALTDPAGRWGDADPARRRFDRTHLLALLSDAGLVPSQVHGVRVFTDLVAGGLLDAEPQAFEELARLEAEVAALPPYRDVATQLHVLATRAG